jgi:hypothetical protein
VQAVKNQIQTEHNLPADQMKLIAYGKVMEDNDKSLKDYSIKEGDFLVVMIAKVIISFRCSNILTISINSLSQWPSPKQKSKSRRRKQPKRRPRRNRSRKAAQQEEREELAEPVHPKPQLLASLCPQEQKKHSLT